MNRVELLAGAAISMPPDSEYKWLHAQLADTFQFDLSCRQVDCVHGQGEVSAAMQGRQQLLSCHVTCYSRTCQL